VNESGNENDVPEERFLVYHDLGLLVTADQNGFVCELIAVTDRPHIFAPKDEVLQEQLSQMVKQIERLYHMVLLSA
jgi:hypothetical protein